MDLRDKASSLIKSNPFFQENERAIWLERVYHMDESTLKLLIEKLEEHANQTKEALLNKLQKENGAALIVKIEKFQKTQKTKFMMANNKKEATMAEKGLAKALSNLQE